MAQSMEVEARSIRRVEYNDNGGLAHVRYRANIEDDGKVDALIETFGVTFSPAGEVQIAGAEWDKLVAFVNAVEHERQGPDA